MHACCAARAFHTLSSALLQAADWNLLLLGGLVSIIKLTHSFTLPTFGVSERNWPAFFAFVTSLAVSCGLPPAHSFLQWAFMAPVFT